MKLGIMAYATKTGLGFQTKAFVDFLEPSKVMAVDISQYNNMEVYYNWYKNAQWVTGFPTDSDIRKFLDGLDVVLVCETPLNWNFFSIARQMGVKTVLQYNYEFLEYFRKPELPAPDLLASPSYWEIDRVEALGIAPVEYLPLPVDEKRYKFRQWDKVNTLVHIMGRPAQDDRNGTIDFCEMAIELGKDYKYIIYGQTPVEIGTKLIYQKIEPFIVKAQRVLGDNLEVNFEDIDNYEMYERGDVLVLPRKYGGLCLPLWEGLSAGMPVIMTDKTPNDKVLPKEWLADCEPEGFTKTHSEIPMDKCTTKGLVKAFENILKAPARSNERAKTLSLKMSWDNMKPIYLKVFEQLCK